METTGKLTLQIMKEAKWYNSWLFSCVEKYVKGDILEVGAGIGNFSKPLSMKGNLYAIDFNRKYLPKIKNATHGKVKAGFGDLENGRYFFENKEFDSIVCMNVLEHIRDDNRALFNVNRLLKKDGRFILLVPAFQFAFGRMDTELGHFRRYSMSEAVSKIQGNGMKLINAGYLNWLGLIGWYLNSVILKKSVIPKSQLRIFNYISRPFLLMESFFKAPFGLSLLIIATKEK